MWPRPQWLIMGWPVVNVKRLWPILSGVVIHNKDNTCYILTFLTPIFNETDEDPLERVQLKVQMEENASTSEIKWIQSSLLDRVRNWWPWSSDKTQRKSYKKIFLMSNHPAWCVVSEDWAAFGWRPLNPKWSTSDPRWSVDKRL